MREARLPGVDAERVGMLGHSMGGGVTLNALTAMPGLVDAAVLFAPVSGDYEPGQPECGFLYPAFCDRSSDWNYVDIYQKNPERPHNELRKILGV